MVYFAVWIFALLAALEAFGVKTTSFVAILGAAGLAVGLALQGSLANFASGVMILIFRPFKIGDFVEAGGVKGKVVEISVFTTVFNTPDNQRIIVPNGGIMGGNITNVTAMDTRRVDLVAGISYGDDIDQAKQLFMGLCTGHPKVLADPAPVVKVVALADSSVNLVVRPWCKTEDYWDVYFDLTEQIKKACDANGLNIPFPQRDVHLFQETR
jgi:small conductance mechanosensitive channel